MSRFTVPNGLGITTLAPSCDCATDVCCGTTSGAVPTPPTPVTPGEAVWGGITGTLANQIDLVAALGAKEGDLGNPSVNGMVLSSTVGGVRSWVTMTSGSGGGGTWGSITGTLSSQTDLMAALNGKAASSHGHAQSDITNLVSDLSGKANLSGGNTFDGLQSFSNYVNITDGVQLYASQAVGFPLSYISLAGKNFALGYNTNRFKYEAGLGTFSVDAGGDSTLAIMGNPVLDRLHFIYYGVGAATGQTPASQAKVTVDLFNGRLGVGTASPSYPLHVIGDGLFSGLLRLGTTPTTVSSAAGKLLVGSFDTTGTPSATTFLRGDGAWAVPAGGSGSVAWGAISGTLSSQTDLNSALSGKEASLGNPDTNGKVLASTTGGVRSWVSQSTGAGISAWVTATSYGVGDIAYQSEKIYRCATAHTAGTFATDLAAVRWVELSTASDKANLSGGNTISGDQIFSNRIGIGKTPTFYPLEVEGNAWLKADSTWCILAIQSGLLTNYQEAGVIINHSSTNWWTLVKTGDAAGDFVFKRHNNAGDIVDSPLSISRSTGNVTILKDLLTSGLLKAGTTPTTLTSAAGKLLIAALDASGTPSSSTYLRGDGTWNTPAGGGTSTVDIKSIWLLG